MAIRPASGVKLWSPAPVEGNEAPSPRPPTMETALCPAQQQTFDRQIPAHGHKTFLIREARVGKLQPFVQQLPAHKSIVAHFSSRAKSSRTPPPPASRSVGVLRIPPLLLPQPVGRGSLSSSGGEGRGEEAFSHSTRSILRFTNTDMHPGAWSSPDRRIAFDEGGWNLELSSKGIFPLILPTDGQSPSG